MTASQSPRTRARHARPTRWQRLVERTRERTVRVSDLRPVLRIIDGQFPARVTLGASPDACIHAATGEAAADGHTRRTACGRTFLRPHAEHTPRTHAQKRFCEQCRTSLENPCHD
ncbi:hypothetical protein ACWD2L_00700 [Streptomyces sp. NPDC002754]